MTALQRLRADLGGTWTPLSGGLSHEVWHVARDAGPALIVRLPDGSPDAALFARDPSAEWIALNALAATGIAPRPVSQLPGVVVAEYLPGESWAGEFAAVGRCLRMLHEQPVPDGLPRDGRDPRDGGRAILAMCRDRALLAREPERSGGSGMPVFLHGDPVPGNIVMARGHARLIDWQCPAVGPAPHDIALFLSPAMQVIARGRPASDTEIAAFIDGYGHLPDGDWPALHWQIACHCQWRIEQGHEAYRAALAAELRALDQATRLQ